MDKCNGCSITNEKTFPFIAISNIYGRYVLFKKISYILLIVIILLIIVLIYMCYNFNKYKDYGRNNNLNKSDMNSFVEEKIERSNL